MSRTAKERFTRIAGRYDFMNHFLSMGIDRKWREEAAKEAILDKRSFSVLDSATGTGDFAFAIYDLAEEKGKRVRITATDFVKKMLYQAVKKAGRSGRNGITFGIGDSLRTGFSNGSFDVVATAFSLRNFDSTDAFLRESYRILASRGRLVVLEMAMPDEPSQRRFFDAYSYFMRLSSVFAGREYSWLVDSIMKFDKHLLAGKTRAAGFRRVRLKPLASGIAFVMVAEK